MNISQVKGGNINSCFRLETVNDLYFVKVNTLSNYADLFELEKKGLIFLKETSAFNIPRVISVGSDHELQWIIMTYINGARRKINFWEDYGRTLALMHQNSFESFGLHYNNYIGVLSQQNGKQDNWGAFFRENRILPVLKEAEKKRLLRNEMRHLFDLMLDRVDGLFPKEKPSALHGDLWSGNFMTDSNGQAAIFDPAVYYGHREMDIGMTKLFGGFDQIFYDSYNETFPLEPDWEERVAIANIYPLLVHLVLFGRSYLNQVELALKRFS
ncbi:MAG: fructosamine kinase family protein [Flavobacteriales bacterium]|nr:fructosamine kinase family protein [Flavobacteriales bacterium]